MRNRYRDLNSYLRSLFGCRVQKISVDAGLSCPNRDGTIARGGCIYCNARGSGTGAHARGLTVGDQLREGKRILAKRYQAGKFIAYFQSFSNTYAPLPTLERLYEEALGVEDVVGLAVGTRPDCVGRAVLDLLAGFAASHLVWLEYGLQSASDKTLGALNRGHDVACFTAAVKAAHDRNLPVCAHAILGLPGETRDDMMATADYLTRLGVEGVKLHLLYVIEGTPLERLYRLGGYRCLEQRQYVNLVCDFLERLSPAVVIQRLTGDPHPHELVAPAWALRKGETLAMIRQALETRNSWQGKSTGALAPL